MRDTLAEIEKFRREAGEKLDEKIYDAYGFDFNPVLWGYTTSSFLDELAKILTT
ncbi:contact-dependent growth inhibition system immunity protein [Paraburkholderia sp. UCT70]|uniref:contact-dependent growth inhibition system immunity protein n=1 Tax=Paraburkholderia sp. UCT70 TaxID=2991068 RepID=UPI003D1A54F0